MSDYTVVFTSGGVPNMVREFVIDTVDKLSSIDISQLLAGSKVFVIQDSQYYMLSNARTWEPIYIGGGSGSSANENSDETIAYTATLLASNWSNNGTYTLSVPNLTCGDNGTVPPIISCFSNQAEYNYIGSADADPDQDQIVFTLKQGASTPLQDIGITIVDIK